METSASIAPFKSTKADYPRFQKAIFKELSEAKNPHDPSDIVGLLPNAISEESKERFPALRNLCSRYNRCVKPPDLAPDASSAATLLYKNASEALKWQTDAENRMNIRVGSLLPSTITSKSTLFGVQTLNYGQMLIALSVEFGELSVEDCNAERAKMSKPPASNATYAEIAEIHHTAYTALDEYGTGMNETDRVHYLQQAVLSMQHDTTKRTGLPCTWASSAITKFLDNFPRLKDQTYANLDTILATHASRLQPESQNPYAASAAVTSPPEKDLLADAHAEIKRLKLQLQRRTPAPEKTAATKQPEDDHHLYCWTHGGCNHRGSNCPKKDPGHDDTAWFRNLLGGSTLHVRLAEGPGKKA